MHRIVLLVSLVLDGVGLRRRTRSGSADPPDPGAVTTPELVATLAERDHALFDAVFGCDIDARCGR